MKKGTKRGEYRNKLQRKLTVQSFIDKIFQAHDPVKLAAKFLNSEDEAVASKVYLKLIEYRYGQPVAKNEHGGPGGGPIPVNVTIRRVNA